MQSVAGKDSTISFVTSPLSFRKILLTGPQRRQNTTDQSGRPDLSTYVKNCRVQSVNECACRERTPAVTYFRRVPRFGEGSHHTRAGVDRRHSDGNNGNQDCGVHEVWERAMSISTLWTDTDGIVSLRGKPGIPARSIMMTKGEVAAVPSSPPIRLQGRHQWGQPGHFHCESKTTHRGSLKGTVRPMIKREV